MIINVFYPFNFYLKIFVLDHWRNAALGEGNSFPVLWGIARPQTSRYTGKHINNV